jgi:hypothetical protein
MSSDERCRLKMSFAIPGTFFQKGILRKLSRQSAVDGFQEGAYSSVSREVERVGRVRQDL